MYLAFRVPYSAGRNSLEEQCLMIMHLCIKLCMHCMITQIMGENKALVLRKTDYNQATSANTRCSADISMHY
jgi:hypothetical protein